MSGFIDGIVKEAISAIKDIISDVYDPNNNCIDVCVQDQTSPPIDFFFVQGTGTPTTLVTATAIDDYDIVLTSAAGCSIGDYFGLFNTEANRAYFGTILNIVSNTITMDTPVDFEFQIGDTAACFDRNLNKNGSVTAQIFEITVGPNATQAIDINRIMISMITVNAVSLAKFGDLAKLTKGLVLRRVNGDTRNIWNVKDNGELANLCFDYDPYTTLNAQQGQNGAKFRYTLNGQDKHGVAVRLAPGESLQLIIQDDLQLLTQFRVIAEGHYVVSGDN